jgi:hypothetical protein
LRLLKVLLTTMIALAGVLAGCASPSSPVPTAGPLTPTVAASAASPGDAGPLVILAATPTARRGLEATDPTTVTLADGRPTLVEFFAFW